MNEPSVSVRNLTKSFSGRRVVDDLSFNVQKGEVFALLGHNGAGKSTTIDEVIEASGQNNLEEAYLFFMGEEELL